MKNCASCGKENFDEAVFCAGCGSPLAQPPVPEAPPVEEPTVSAPVESVTEPAAETPAAPAEVPAAPQADAYTYTEPASPAAPAESNKATLWLILNIVATVLCCCANIFGIIGIIFAGIGMSSYKKGDYEDMNKKSKIAMIMFIIAAVSVVIGWIVAIFSPLLAMVPFLTIG